MTSVCMATYNGGLFLREQLQSIVEQLDPERDEVVISDDGSTDDTLQVIAQMQAACRVTIRLVKNEGEHGYTSNFENALRYAQGDWIMLSDQDDVWLPNKLERMKAEAHLCKRRDCRLIVSNAIITDGELHHVDENYFAARGVKRGLWGNILKFGYLGCCLAFDRQLLQKALPFPTNRRYCTHDNWLFLCASALGEVRIIEEPLMLYRRHGYTSTTGAMNAHKPVGFRIAYRMYLLWQLFCRSLRKE